MPILPKVVTHQNSLTGHVRPPGTPGARNIAPRRSGRPTLFHMIGGDGRPRMLPALPSQVDLREGFPYPPLNQAPYGVCTPCAAAALFAYLEQQSTGRAEQLSPRFLYFVARMLMRANVGAGYEGVEVHKVMQALVSIGAAPESFWPFDAADTGGSFTAEPSNFVYALARNHRAQRFERIDASGPDGQHPDVWVHPEDLLADVRTILAAKSPLILATSFVFDTTGSSISAGPLEFATKHTPGGVWPVPTDAEAKLARTVAETGDQDLTQPLYVYSHSIVACGYDDDKPVAYGDGSPAGKGALLIRNSWSTDWGEGGYGWLPYQYVLQNMTEDWWRLIKTSWTPDVRQFEE